MITRRLTPVAVLLAAVLTMGSVQAQAETVEILRFAPADDPLQDRSFVGAPLTIVVLHNTGETYTAQSAGSISGKTFSLYDAVLIDRTNYTAFMSAFVTRIQIGLFQTAAPLPVGARLALASSDPKQACVDDDNQVVSCVSEEASVSLWLTTIEIVSSRNSSPMLFTSTATVTDDSLGVITGQQDEFGFAEVVVTNKGEKPTFATLLTDEPLEPADRIADIIQLDYDPETGIALYGGFLKY